MGKGRGTWARARAGLGRARVGLDRGANFLYSISLASNQVYSANRKPQLDERMPRHNIRQNKYALA
jgi:hypothetical protein